jgi:hypothetical protein
LEFWHEAGDQLWARVRQKKGAAALYAKMQNLLDLLEELGSMPATPPSFGAERTRKPSAIGPTFCLGRIRGRTAWQPMSGSEE